ncbi:MAG: hypothetical protein AABY83_06080 [Pseudomonadota bacterium]
MRGRKTASRDGIYQILADIAMQMLTMFLFIFIITLMTYKLATTEQVPKLKAEIQELRAQLANEEKKEARLKSDLEHLAASDPKTQADQVLGYAGLEGSKGRKDFDLFVQGLHDLPGKDLHLIVDASGSMHGISNFLIPILRLIVTRSGKKLTAITWFSDGNAATYSGTMGEMFDHLMEGAPFTGYNETIGDAFKRAAQNAPAPGAYLLIGDEPATDEIHYFSIPAPVFTLPLGRDNPDTLWEYQTLAEKTHGKMMRMIFK